MKQFIYILSAALLFHFSSLQAQTDRNTEARVKRIENGLMPVLQVKGEEVPLFNIEERLKQLNIPGLSIAFVSNGEVEWARAYGMADKATNRPMTTETMLLAGSVSKPISALRAHQLIEVGTFDLDADVNAYLSSWKLPDNEFTKTEKVTLGRILNHTAGLTVWGFPGYSQDDKTPTVPEILDGKGNTDAVRVYQKPGESWMYSGGGYTIMQLAIADTEGMSFPATMQAHVLNPLGMQNSTFENPLPTEYHGIAATGYYRNGNEIEGKWPIHPEVAAAGLWTTPTQLIQYAIEIQKILNTKKDGILKYESVKAMLTPRMNDHGLGPKIVENMFGHGGASKGFRAQMYAWKDKPHAVVIMINAENDLIIQEVLLAVVKEYGLQGISPDIRENVAMTADQLAPYVGKYNVERMGNIELKQDNGHLFIHAAFSPQPIQLNAEPGNNFYVARDGVRFVFELKDGKAVRFEAQGLKGKRID